MRSHMFVHRATTKCFSNPFVFKTRIEKEGLPRDNPSDLGAGGPRFKSGRPDQNISNELLGLRMPHFTRKILPLRSRDRRSEQVSCSIQKC